MCCYLKENARYSGRFPFVLHITNNYTLQTLCGEPHNIGNEEAKLIGLEGNRRINGGIYAGTILIAGDDGAGGTRDLTDDQIRRYTDMFRTPEHITPEEVQRDIWCAFVGFDEIS